MSGLDDFALLYDGADIAYSPDEWAQTNWYRRNGWGNLVPTAIDPDECGCTECIIGEYVPLVYANAGMIRDMVAGYIRNNTDLDYWVEFEPSGMGGWTQKLASRYR